MFSPYLRSPGERRVMDDGQIVVSFREVFENSPRRVDAADSSWDVQQTHHGLWGDVGQRRKIFGSLVSHGSGMWQNMRDLNAVTCSRVFLPKKQREDQIRSSSESCIHTHLELNSRQHIPASPAATPTFRRSSPYATSYPPSLFLAV